MKTRIIIALLLTSAVTSAQVKWTLEGGYDLTTHLSTNNAVIQPLHGGHINTSMYWKFKPDMPFGLKTGLKLQFTGYYGHEHKVLNEPSEFDLPVEYDEHISDFAVSIPLRICFMHELNDSWGITFIAGPQLSYHFATLGCRDFKWWNEDHNKGTNWHNNLDGKIEVTDKDGNVVGQGTYSSDNYHGMNCSMGVGIGAHYKHLVFSATCDFRLFGKGRYTQNSYDAGDHLMYSRELEISVGYCF
ncbi:MAG: hypothetical protein IJ776_06600 [Paludibacteraceae bacterium]|nr:hypothetical protein [Paludibacteraceae bacterium]